MTARRLLPLPLLLLAAALACNDGEGSDPSDFSTPEGPPRPPITAGPGDGGGDGGGNPDGGGDGGSGTDGGLNPDGGVP